MPAYPQTPLSRWAASGTKSQQIAAHLAQWAATRPGNIVPAPDVIITRLTTTMTITSPTTATVNRAIKLLADRGILRRDTDTGHYHVTPAQPGTAPPRPGTAATQATTQQARATTTPGPPAAAITRARPAGHG